MVAAVVVQTFLILLSGAFNGLLTPSSQSVTKELFVSSVILMLGVVQGIAIIICKLLLRKFCRVHTNCGMHLLLKPLSTAMSTAKTDRPGENGPSEEALRSSTGAGGASSAAPPPNTDHSDMEAPHASVRDNQSLSGFSDLDEGDVMRVDERNVYSDVYLLGFAAFSVTYCSDTSSVIPSISFVFTLLAICFLQSLHVITVLLRSIKAQSYMTDTDEAAKQLNTKRGLTVATAALCILSFLLYIFGFAGRLRPLLSSSVFDFVFSIILPMLSPLFLITISPKHNPLRVIFECTPFIFCLCISYSLFFLASRGTISTVIHEVNQISNSSLAEDADPTKLTASSYLPAFDLEIHQESNSSIHFKADLSTSADRLENLPLLLLAPIVKIPLVILVLANTINRSFLTICSAMLFVLSCRSVVETKSTDYLQGSGGLFIAALVLSAMAVLVNVAKHLFVK